MVNDGGKSPSRVWVKPLYPDERLSSDQTSLCWELRLHIFWMLNVDPKKGAPNGNAHFHNSGAGTTHLEPCLGSILWPSFLASSCHELVP